MLSIKRYGWLCVLGAETAYIVCLVGGLSPWRTSRAAEFHRTLFETLPGFTWLNFGSFFLGAVYVFVFAWIFGAYMVWMHNTSLIEKKQQ